jgi:hypothetical protein
MSPYLLLGVLVILALAAIVAIYWLASKVGTKHRFIAFLLGPAYLLIKKGDQKISTREWLLFALLALFMLLTPVVSYWIDS